MDVCFFPLDCTCPPWKQSGHDDFGPAPDLLPAKFSHPQSTLPLHEVFVSDPYELVFHPLHHE